MMATPTLLPDPICLHLNLLDASESAITVVVTTTAQEAVCLPTLPTRFRTDSLAIC